MEYELKFMSFSGSIHHLPLFVFFKFYIEIFEILGKQLTAEIKEND